MVVIYIVSSQKCQEALRGCTTPKGVLRLGAAAQAAAPRTRKKGYMGRSHGDLVVGATGVCHMIQVPKF